MLTNHFSIYALLPVQGKVSSLTSIKDLHDGAEGNSNDIKNYIDELVAKKNGQRFIFNWKPDKKFVSTFPSLKKDKKSKKEPKKFKLTLTARLYEEGKNVWSMSLTFENAWGKDARSHSAIGGQTVDIDYDKATPSNPTHY